MRQTRVQKPWLFSKICSLEMGGHCDLQLSGDHSGSRIVSRCVSEGRVQIPKILLRKRSATKGMLLTGESGSGVDPALGSERTQGFVQNLVCKYPQEAANTEQISFSCLFQGPDPHTPLDRPRTDLAPGPQARAPGSTSLDPPVQTLPRALLPSF